MLERGREFGFGLELDDQQNRLEVGAKATRQEPNMATRLSRDERNAVAQRIFAALCAHYPKHYVALIESEVAANSPDLVLSAARATAQDLDHSVG